MENKAQVIVNIVTLQNGKKIIKVVGKSISENFKNELLLEIGLKAKYIKVVEECNTNYQTSQL